MRNREQVTHRWKVMNQGCEEPVAYLHFRFGELSVDVLDIQSGHVNTWYLRYDSETEMLEILDNHLGDGSGGVETLPPVLKLMFKEQFNGRKKITELYMQWIIENEVLDV